MKILGAGRLSPVFKPKRYSAFVGVLIVAAGISSGIFAAGTNGAQKREYLIGRAQTISDTLPTADVVSLKGSQDDLSTLTYFRVKGQLEQVRSSNLDIARIRLFSLDGTEVIIKADGQTPDSANYASPGTRFPEASPALKGALTSRNAGFDRITQDYSGNWVAAYAPVYDEDSGKTVGAVGAFIPAQDYYIEILLYALVPMLLAAIPLAGILRDIKIQAKEHEIMQLKNQFVSIASHELRSPLTGMLWGITSLQSDEKHFNKSQQQLLHDMFKSTEASLATVNEILDQSIFERGHAANLQRDSVDIRAVITQVRATLNLGAQEKKIGIEESGAWPTHAFVVGDVGALKRAFMNIIANAIKYSPDKSSVSLTYRTTDANEHIIAIADHGIGIPAGEQQRVMQGYYRASNASEVQAHGTGLGLWVTELIIKEHKGRVWINSVEGKGTTVYIALPMTTIPTHQSSAKPVDSVSQDSGSSKNT
jgi:signal transduction histidine kinase